MIKLTRDDGRTEFVAVSDIKRLVEAGTGSQFNGTRAYVHVSDAVIPVNETVFAIADMIQKEESNKS